MSENAQSPDDINSAEQESSYSSRRPQKKKTPRPPKKITESYLANSGLYYLQRFPASTAQFRRVMMRKISKSLKHHEEPEENKALEMLDAVTDKFIEYGYLNDPAYAKGLVKSLRNRGTSQAKISAKLREKGIQGDLLNQALHVENPREEDLKSALIYLKKKRRGIFTLRDKENAHEKDLAALARQGFSYDVANTALNMSIDETAEYFSDF